MFDSRTIKACRAWLGLCDSGITLKDSTLEDAVDSFRKLVEVAEGYEELCKSQEEYIKSLLKTVGDQGVMIDNLRADLDDKRKAQYAAAAVSSLTKMVWDHVDTIAEKDTKIEDLKVLIDNQDSLIKHLRNALGCASSDMKDQDTIIANLRKDIEGMSRENARLRELNDNQARIIYNSRKYW